MRHYYNTNYIILKKTIIYMVFNTDINNIFIIKLDLDIF